MFPKSPMRQMYPNPGQQPYTPYPIPQLPPMAQKKKGFLAKLFKKHDPTEPYMQMVPPYRQIEGPPMMHQQPPPQYRQQYQQQYQHQYPQQYQQQYQPYMQQHPEQMIPPQMYESNDTRGGAATTATSSSGIGSFFSNLISNPTTMINNIEKVSQVVQSVSPVVEQYGPIMRNLPSIVKILTSGKSTEENPTEDQTEDVTEKVEVATPHPPSKKRKRKKMVIEPVIEKEVREEPVQKIATKPKLYV
ncbi:YqfQ family protein [Bacillus pacificus]|uniref:VrrA/YqfQ family protein n=1 Tax=Bacillus cereus group TaxID=86661 RepID=UPI000789D10A|nr:MULTISPECIES: VrrA/YqfQ family protein [Bacillus cereus group]ASI79610.1 VrrA protein [Bacillus cereus]MCC2348177.1 YqfQ family protein [Bacillus pacificus]MCC2388234.1 YqfQ family protein [Bacillus pacificus]MCC2465317.1 YqfQ family protein [Bacillus pacificus]MCC2469862.1 YqfQ family protein [Bacillus pacificus]